MTIYACKYLLFTFAFFIFAGVSASAQSDQSRCVLKVFVNDPFAQIFVDGKALGAQPQMIACSDQEKNIVVKSSDGQTFTRLMKSEANFDLNNTTLNIVFHRKMNEYVYNNDGAIHGLVYSAEQAAANAAKAAKEAAEKSAQAVREIANEPIVKQPLTKEQELFQVHREVTSALIEQVEVKPKLKHIQGIYVQVFALKNFDVSKIEDDIEKIGNLRLTQQELTTCTWKNAQSSQKWALVLMGPYNQKNTADEIKNIVGGNSFVVTDPGCIGEFTKVKQ